MGQTAIYGDLILGDSRLSNTHAPSWPPLDAEQKAEALTAVWPARLRQTLLGAAVLASATAYIANTTVVSAGVDWSFGISLTLAGSFLCAYFLLRTHKLSRRWLAPIGLTTMALAQVNLMMCLMARLAPGNLAQIDAGGPALIFMTLVGATLWGLRVHVTLGGFALGAMLTTAVLWLPWVVMTGAPAAFLFTGVACLAAGAQMRWFAAERAYGVYRRKVVWPRLWRGSVQAAALRELSVRTAATGTPEPIGPIAPPAGAGEDSNVYGSLVSLASFLGPAEAPAGQVGETEHAATKTADSRE